MSHWHLVRSSSYNPLLLFTHFHSGGFLFLVMIWKEYLGKKNPTKSTVYRLTKYCFCTTGIMSHDPFTDFLNSSLCFKLVSDVDKGQKSLTLLCLHPEENVQCLFVFPIILYLFLYFLPLLTVQELHLYVAIIDNHDFILTVSNLNGISSCLCSLIWTFSSLIFIVIYDCRRYVCLSLLQT